MTKSLKRYSELLTAIKARIRQGQIKAALSANAEMIQMYWDIGRMVEERQQQEGWGAAVIPRLAKDIRNELPEIKGFSARNIGRMIAFYRHYPHVRAILPQAVAKTAEVGEPRDWPQPVANLTDAGLRSASLAHTVVQIPWGHNLLLMEKIKDAAVRLWYMQQTIIQGWSRDVLAQMIKADSYARQGNAVNNFE